MERISLRACFWRYGDQAFAGVALPDGRLIFAEDGAIATYSSDVVFHHLHPNAELVWDPHGDATMNYVMELPDANHRRR